MAWTPADRNYTGIQHEGFRRTFAPAFDVLHDALSDAYYNFWRQGQSRPFQGYDVQPTLAESKALFGKLHALIFYHYDVEFHAENLRRLPAERIPEEEYNIVRRRDGSIRGRKADTAQAALAALDTEGIRITLP